MKRFVDLGRQLWVDKEDLEMPRQFAFYCTTIDRFESFDGWQVFDSWVDFAEAFEAGIHGPGDIGRYRCLCPSWVFGNTIDITPKQGELPSP